jgi:hypothetical protein
MTATLSAPVLSDKQRAFILDMLTEISPTESAVARLAVAIERGGFADWKTTRDSIDLLIARRDAKRAAVKAATTVVPAGLYALPIEGVEGGWRFYRVTEGKVAGKRFVKRFRSDLQAEMWPKEAARILDKIAVDTEAAGLAFAAQSERCRRCGKRLTDKPLAAVNHGYGPDCVLLVG